MFHSRIQTCDASVKWCAPHVLLHVFVFRQLTKSDGANYYKTPHSNQHSSHRCSWASRDRCAVSSACLGKFICIYDVIIIRRPQNKRRTYYDDDKSRRRNFVQNSHAFCQRIVSACCVLLHNRPQQHTYTLHKHVSRVTNGAWLQCQTESWMWKKHPQAFCMLGSMAWS